MGSISGAYEQAFGFFATMDEEAKSDEDDDELCEGMAKLKVFSKEKARIRAPWSQSIIVKAFGKSVGFVYMSSKLRTMWNPSGRMDCVDMGHDFFLIKFELQIDLDKVLKKGPWFVGQQFLAIRQWEPKFKASKATCSSIAVWIRLPELLSSSTIPSCLRMWGVQLVLCFVLILIRLMALEVDLQESMSRLT